MEDAIFRNELIKAAFLDEVKEIFAFKAGMIKSAGIGRGVAEALEDVLRMEAKAAPGAAAEAAETIAGRGAVRGARSTMAQRLRAIREAQAAQAAKTNLGNGPIRFSNLPEEPLPDITPNFGRAAPSADELIARPMGRAGGAAAGEAAASAAARAGARWWPSTFQRLRPWLPPLAAGGIGYALTGNPLVGLLAGFGTAGVGYLGRGAARLAGSAESIEDIAMQRAAQRAARAPELLNQKTIGDLQQEELASLKALAKENPELAARMAAARAPRYGTGFGIVLPAALATGYFGLKGAKDLIMGDQPNNLGVLPSLAAGAASAYGVHKLLENTDIPWLQGPLAQYGLPLLAGMVGPQFASSIMG